MSTNEAAERLRNGDGFDNIVTFSNLLDEALAAARRATALVEQDKDGFWGFSERGARILNAAGTHDGKVDVMDLLHALAVAEGAGR